MDRIVLGQHANTTLGPGLYVSIPGANVMHPEYAQHANLMFDSNTTRSLFNVIQTGTFKIICSRKSISGRGETIGNRLNDTQELFLDGGSGHINAHTFSGDTGRPSNMTTVANWNEAKDLGYQHKSVGTPTRGKQSNYLDTGSQTVSIDAPLPNGEVPKVALRFAVGNSTGHFHPWYANTVKTSDTGNWSDIDYASGNTQQIVHMDSTWMRLKWGGLGAEEYRGIQNDYFFPNSEDSISYSDSVIQFFGGDAAAAANLGFSSAVDMETKLKNSKLLSTAINNSQGIVGLIPTVNSTTITVDAYMTPTHAGLRQPVDRTFEKNKGRQKGVGFNAIDDYAHINFPMESHPHTSGLTDAQIREDLNARKFKHLPGIPPPGDIFRADGGDFDYEDHGKRDMFGWGGHPTEFFVNPFSNGNCTFYTHMQPPYLAGSFYPGYRVDYVPEVSWDPAYYSLTEPRGHNPVHEMAHTGTYMPVSLLNPDGGNYGKYYANESGRWGPYMLNWRGPGPLSEADNENLWQGNNFAGDPVTVGVPEPNGDDSKVGDPIGTAGTPSRSVFNGAGIKWPAGHYHADYLDYRDWTGSMGLDGAGSKESLAKEDVWDTFYVSYVVYSAGIVPPSSEEVGVASEAGRGVDPLTDTVGIAPKGIVVDVRSVDHGGDLQATEKYKNNQNNTDQYYFNLKFPDDFVGTIGDEATDPFWEHRNYADPLKRIYGNVHIVLKIPRVQGKNNDDVVFLASETMSYETVEYGGISFHVGSGTPDPVIDFDLSNSKFIFGINNKDISLVVENYGIILGGGGSGGKGNKAGSIYGLVSPHYGGGGGGAGGGSGMTVSPPDSVFGEHRGVGRGGSGWMRGGGGIIAFPANYEDIVLEMHKGDSGSDLSFVLLNDASTTSAYSTRNSLLGGTSPGGSGAGVAISATAESPDPTYKSTSEPNEGGAGGNVFGFDIVGNDPSVKLKVEIVNKNSPDGGAFGGVIASGGGGGGGGYGGPGGDGSLGHTDGKSGAAAGTHGNELGSYYSQGGPAGYLIEGLTVEPVTVINESIYSIKTRGRMEYSSWTPGAVGFQVDIGETKKY